MRICTKILATLGAFLLASLLVESALIFSVKTAQPRAATCIAARHVSGRFAPAVKRAGGPGPLPAGEARPIRPGAR